MNICDIFFGLFRIEHAVFRCDTRLFSAVFRLLFFFLVSPMINYLIESRYLIESKYLIQLKIRPQGFDSRIVSNSLRRTSAAVQLVTLMIRRTVKDRWNGHCVARSSLNREVKLKCYTYEKFKTSEKI